MTTIPEAVNDLSNETPSKEEMFEYLDELRESGETNMFGAAAYLVSEFEIDRSRAKDVLMEWMRTFGARHPR